MTDRLVNFAPGPAILAPSVLAGLSEAVLGIEEVGGLSILEISHRSKFFDGVLAETSARLRGLMGVPDTHAVLFLQGGARGQFAQVPLNFLRPGRRAAFVDTGVWATGALEEARTLGDAYCLASSADGGYHHLPELAGRELAPDTEYVHTTSNNTIYGTQWQELPDFGAVRHVCDMSSDVLSRPIDVSRFGLIYAGAQKNAGTAGVTLVVVDRRWIAEARADIPTIWQYAVQDKKDSCYNTPPTFAIYALMLVLRWLEEQGGVAGIARLNDEKAKAIYSVIDDSGGFYRPFVKDPAHRSRMNVCFGLPDDARHAAFLAGAKEAGLDSLKGHRTAGGIRASIYNQMPLDGVMRLVDYLRAFQRRG